MANPCRVCSTVSRVVSYGEGVYLVDFSVESRFTKFKAGQFLHLALDEFDPSLGYWPESRVFSIASRAKQGFVTIVYSVKGPFTRRMEAELVPGRSVWLKFPYGNFVVDEELVNSGPLVLIAGGTGVSPYVPFLTSSGDRAGTVHLFYGVRKAEHLLFREEWRRLSDRPWFRLHLTVEEGGEGEFLFETGRLSIGKVESGVGCELSLCTFYLSGPPGMIKNFRSELLSRGVGADRVYIDEWE